MMRCARQSVLSLLVLMVASLFGTVQADTSPIGVPLDQRVIDLTNTLDAATTSRLKNQLADLEQRKGSQVAVLLVPTTGGASIEDYANQLFRAWKLGRKDINDGILLVVAKDDRKVRIEVGYGLEGTVTDLLAHRIIEEHITPAFRQGNFVGGVARGVNDLITLVEGGDLPTPAEPGLPLGASAVLLAFIVGALGGVLVVTRKLHWRYALIATVVLTLLVAVFAGGREWPVYLLVLPLNLLISAAVFAVLWQVRWLFYCALTLLIYIISLLVVNQYTEFGYFDWFTFLLGAAAMLGWFLVLLCAMQFAWDRNRVGFFVRLLVTIGLYVALSLEATGPDSWLQAVPITAFLGVFIFMLTLSDMLSSLGSGYSRSRSGTSGSGASSSRSSGGGGSGRGGSSGGGGASGSW